MIGFLCIALSIALVAAVFALCREIRLRKALARLLNLILERWRRHGEIPPTQHPSTSDHDPDHR